MFVGSYQLEDKVLDNIRHFLDIDCLDHNILKDIISHAIELKASKPKTFPSALGRTLALIFEKPSTRTRVSFEVGMLQLGGNVVILNDKETQLSRGETVADTSRLLSRYADIIMLFLACVCMDRKIKIQIPTLNAQILTHRKRAGVL